MKREQYGDQVFVTLGRCRFRVLGLGPGLGLGLVFGLRRVMFRIAIRVGVTVSFMFRITVTFKVRLRIVAPLLGPWIPRAFTTSFPANVLVGPSSSCPEWLAYESGINTAISEAPCRHCRGMTPALNAVQPLTLPHARFGGGATLKPTPIPAPTPTPNLRLHSLPLQVKLRMPAPHRPPTLKPTPTPIHIPKRVPADDALLDPICMPLPQTPSHNPAAAPNPNPVVPGSSSSPSTGSYDTIRIRAMRMVTNMDTVIAMVVVVVMARVRVRVTVGAMPIHCRVLTRDYQRRRAYKKK